MTDYTVHHAIPYPEGGDQVAVHTDVEALAMKIDVELHDTHRLVVRAVDGAVPEHVTNLFDWDAAVSGTLSPTGLIIPHDFNRASPFIPVLPGQSYVSRSTTGHRVVWFDHTQTAISGTNTDMLPANQTAEHTAPIEARWVRIGATASENVTPNMVFNQGTDLWSPDEPVVSDWWSDRELPPNQPVRLTDLTFAQDGKIRSNYVDGAVPERVRNLFDPNDTVLGTLTTGGVVLDNDNNRTTGFITVAAGEQYVATSPLGPHRVIWFDADHAAIPGTNTAWINTGETSHWTAPPGTAYVRMTASLPPGGTMHGVTFNRGTQLVDPDQDMMHSGWWDDRELPPGTGEASVDEHQVQDIVASMLPQWEPDTPNLTFETILEGYQHPLWLSSDGVMLYGRSAYNLVQSSDEWETFETIHEFPYFITGVRTLNDGELLVSNARDSATGLRAKVFKSTGYTRDNPSAATWTEVLESPAPNADINNDWGMQVYENIVLLSEYGQWGEDGARRVWISEDHGNTYRMIFDLMTVEAEGRPEWVAQHAHVHTPAWDPYWNRIWVVVGDGPNAAVYYSDDKGDTWLFAEGTGGPPPNVQYTGIMPLPNAVIFGSDRAPNGVHVYRRGQKTDTPVIRPLLIIDDHYELSRVFMMPFKRDWAPTTPTYFAAMPVDENMAASVITATVDGGKAHLLWEGERPDTNAAFSGRVAAVFGPTAQGNLIAPMLHDPTVTGARVMKAPAPTWTRV